MFSDINLSQIIFTKTPPAWHPYIKIARLDRPIGIWLLFLPCLWGIAMGQGLANFKGHSFGILGLFALGAVLMRSAGCIINDLWDMNLDASVERTRSRPLVSGEISVAHAIRFLAVLLGLSLLDLIMLPHLTIVLGVLSLALVVAYPYMKRITWVPQLFLGFTFNWGALMGWAAVTGSLSKPAILLYIGGIFWTLAYDTIYAHQDIEDDTLVGVKSTARLFGSNSKLFVAGFFVLSVITLIWARCAMTEISFLTPLLSALPAVQAGWQLWTWKPEDPASCLRVFKANQAYGWLALLLLCV